MKRFVAVAAASFLLASCHDAPPPTAPTAPDADLAGVESPAGEVIVLLDPTLAPDGHERNQAAARQVARDLGVEPRHAYGTAVFGFSGAVPEGRLQALERDPRVVHVEPVEAWELAVDFAALALAQATSQVLPTGIDRAEVDRNPTVTTDGSGKAVGLDIAIIDTGIADHADLNIGEKVSFSGGDGNDKNGHGTHVAGTVAAIDNGVGVVGVAPGAKVHAVQVCKPGGICMTGDIVAGIDWVAARKKDFKDNKTGGINFAAANFSISSSDSDKECGESGLAAVHQAICRVVADGVVFGLAAGNSNVVKTPYPVAFSVSAIADFDGKAGGAGSPTCRSDTDDTLAGFSNHGPKVNIAAPGVCILSTWTDGGYNTISGTSMATPHVTGAVALYLHANGQSPATNRTGADAIKDAIVGAAHPQGTNNHVCSYDDSRTGGPLLFTNAAAFKGDGSCEVAGEGEPAPEPGTGTISGTVTDAETAVGIGDATVSVEGTNLSATTNSDGTYSIQDVPEGTHNVTASAEGYQSQTKEASVTASATTTVDFALQADSGSTDPTGTVTVTDIGYTTNGGPSGDRHLNVTIALKDGDGNPVANASVSGTLARDDGASWSFSGTTGSDGTVTFSLKNHGTGCYETTVTAVSADGLEWDGTTPPNQYCKS